MLRFSSAVFLDDLHYCEPPVGRRLHQFKDIYGIPRATQRNLACIHWTELIWNVEMNGIRHESDVGHYDNDTKISRVRT